MKLLEMMYDIIAEAKLCPKGRRYYNKRRKAGEKPSAYLSGRAVQVCKGLMENSVDQKVKCEECGWDWDFSNGGDDPYVCHKCGCDNTEKYDLKTIVMTESLRDWFGKEDWVRIDTQGNIAGKCGTMKKGKPTTRCLPRAKAESLTKAERAATSRKKVKGSKKGKQFVANTSKAKVHLNRKK